MRGLRLGFYLEFRPHRVGRGFVSSTRHVICRSLELPWVRRDEMLRPP